MLPDSTPPGEPFLQRTALPQKYVGSRGCDFHFALLCEMTLVCLAPGEWQMRGIRTVSASGSDGSRLIVFQGSVHIQHTPLPHRRPITSGYFPNARKLAGSRAINRPAQLRLRLVLVRDGGLYEPRRWEEVGAMAGK